MRLFGSSCKVFLSFMKFSYRLLPLIASQIGVTVKKLSTYRANKFNHESRQYFHKILLKIHNVDLLRIFSISILSQNVWILENELLFKLVRMNWMFYDMFLRDTRGQWIYDTAYLYRLFCVSTCFDFVLNNSCFFEGFRWWILWEIWYFLLDDLTKIIENLCWFWAVIKFEDLQIKTFLIVNT